MRILLVEDDDLTGSGVAAGLHLAGFPVDWACDDRDAQLALGTTKYALAVLGLRVPRMSGAETLTQLRECASNVPVLVLTARGSVVERVGTLEADVDDYLGKPFDLSELIACCRALLRRSLGGSVEVIRFRDIAVDPASQTWAVLLQLLTDQRDRSACLQPAQEAWCGSHRGSAGD